jgi:hypothetical protein
MNAALPHQHAIRGWCPPVPLFRRLGVRTQREIGREIVALKTLRGDFDDVRRQPSSEHPAQRARGLGGGEDLT